MAWTDSHCHLQYDGLPPDTLARAEAAGVTRMVCVGTDGPMSKKAVEVARAHPGTVWATVGLHPHDAADGVETIVDSLGAPEVVAIGECGLDYHYHPADSDQGARDTQRQVFAAQVAMATERGLALVIHTREAWDDTFDVLAAEGVPERTIFHCFTGGPTEARRALDTGAHLSFSGILTFKGAHDVRQAAALAPLDRVLVETDAPYLTPVPHRGSPNHPALVALVGAALAEARACDLETVEAATWANTEAVFGLS